MNTPTPEPTLLAGFDRAAATHPSRDALVFLGTRFSYRELQALTHRFAAACRGPLGLDPGDRLLIYLPNCPQWLAGYLGALRAGVVPVPISPIYTARELRHLVRDAGATAVVCADTNFGYVDGVAAAAGVRRIVVTRLGDLLPVWKRAIGLLFDRLPTGTIRRAPGVVSFRRLIARTGAAPSPAGSAATDTAHILYTGGTTGFPKGVPHSHAELVSGIAGLRERLRPHLDGGRQTMVVPLPLFHMFTQDMVFGPGFGLGNTVVLLPRPRTDAILSSVQDHRATMLIGVPALYRFLLENERLHLYDVGSLRHCWSAGDVLPAETASRWRAHTGAVIHQIYGSTETVCVSATPLDREPTPNSIGSVLDARAIRLVDPETLDDVPEGEPGELLVTSAHSYPHGGYWNDAEESAATFVEMDGRLWCRTGDYVRRTDGGELIFVDRRADLIKHKGNRVSASRVEAVLQDHPSVVAAAVVGIPDPDTGETVKAFVILDSDTRGVTAYDLMAHCRTRLLPYEVPAYIEFRDMLPKSKVGKLLRRELR